MSRVSRAGNVMVLMSLLVVGVCEPSAAASPTLRGSVPIGSNTVVQLAVNPSTNRVYAAGPFAQPGLEVVDATVPSAPTLVTTISSAAGGVAVDPATGHFFSSDGYGDRYGNHIVTYDGGTNAPIHSTAENGCGGHFDFDPVRNVVDQVTQCNDSLNVMDAGTLSLVGSRSLGGVGGWVRVNQATGNAYAVSQYTHTLVYGPPPALGVLASLPGEVSAVNPVTNRVYVWPGSGTDLTVYDGSSNLPIGTVPGGTGTTPGGYYSAGVDTQTDRLYEIEANRADVVLIDGASSSVRGMLTLPGSLDVQAVAVDSARHLLYVVGGNYDGPKTLFVYSDGDTTPPTAFIDSHPSDPTNQTTATFTFHATDPDDRSFFFRCQLDGGSFGPCTSPKSYTGLAEGVHTFQMLAVDAAGNPSSPVSFRWTVDTTPPVITVPADITANATGPSGAVVTYTVTATKNATVSCAPPSGSTFPIGVTTVNCTATDTAGNGAVASFHVTVKDAAAQINDLIALVRSFELNHGLEKSLVKQLEQARASLSSGQPDDSCDQLAAFIEHVRAQSGKKLTAAQASQLIAAAQRIEAVIGCPAGGGQSGGQGQSDG